MGAIWVGENASDMPAKVDSAIVFAPAGELVLSCIRLAEANQALQDLKHDRLNGTGVLVIE
jgi:fatty acid-binding protein DegV